MPTCSLNRSLLFLSLGFLYLYKSRVDKKFYTIFSYRVVFQCELMTVCVIAAGGALLVVMC